MLTFLYESGNDAVAYAQINLEGKVRDAIVQYKADSAEDTFVISQVDAINHIGNLVHEGAIAHTEVVVVVAELDKTFHFDAEGALVEYWYNNVPNASY